MLRRILFILKLIKKKLKNIINIKIDKKRIKEYELKTSDLVARLTSLLKTVDILEEGGDLLLKPKAKEITLPEVYKLKEKVKTLHLFGLKGITQVLPIKEGETYVIHCAGSNLEDALAMEEVDATRTTTNQLFEIA